jgi:hypothetical protein
MPEEIEKDLKPNEISDIMSDVASTRPSRKTFAAGKSIGMTWIPFASA